MALPFSRDSARSGALSLAPPRSCPGSPQFLIGTLVLIAVAVGFLIVGWTTVVLAILLTVSIVLAGTLLRFNRTATQHLQIQQAILQSQIEASPDGILIVDENGRWLLHNTRFRQMWSIPEEIARQGSSSLALQAVRSQLPEPDAFIARVQAIYQNRDASSYDEITLKDGRVFDRHSGPLRSAEGQYLGRVWFYRDITDRKRTEQALRSSEALHRTVVQSALDCIITIDHEGHIREFNPAAEATFGWKRADVLGQHMASLIIPPHLRAAHERGMAHYLQTGEGPVLDQTLQLTALRADGQEFPVELTITRVPLDGPPLFTAYLRDITERKEAEQRVSARQQLLDSLRRAQSLFIAEGKTRELFEGLLTNLLALTSSEYGFIGEALRKTSGQLYLKTHAITNIAWDDATRTFYENNAPQGLEFTNLNTLFGAVLTTGNPVIANDPANDPRRGGLPPGHPALRAFLGIPFWHGGELVGMVGIANRPGGYDQSIVEFLAPLVATCGQLIAGLRNDRSRRQATEALLEREARIRSIVESAVDGILVIDEKGIVEAFNPAAERLFGYRADEIIGRNVNLLMPPPFASEHDGYIARYLATGVPHVIGIGREAVARHRDGHDFPVELTVSEVRVAHSRKFTGIVRDITARKQAEANLAERSALASFSAEIGQALAYGDELHEVLDRCARAAVRHLGAALARIWTLNEAEGVLQLQASAGLYTHLDGPHGRIPLGQFKIGQIAQFRQPHLTNNLEGDPGISNPEWVRREGIVAFAGHPLMVQGRVLGVFALFARQPLSAATLETLASAANSLAIGLERLRNLDELRRARAAAEEASQAKSDFLANMSHEVRTPISAVLGYIDILLDGSNDEEDRQRIMKSIRRNGEHLLEIINDILDLSKIEAGKFEVEPILCSPHAIVAEVLSIIGPQAREKSLQLRCPPPDGIPRQIRTDPTRLRQILVNLLGNAVKFTPSGWVELRIKTQPIRAEDAQTTSASCWLLFEVEDQGIGMTPQEMARLFRPFTQADTSTTRKYGGTGLGLSISQRLAMALGGRIEVTSQPGIGSLFTLFLPITAEQMTDLVTAQEWAVSRPPSKDDRAGTILRRKLTGRVLLAEDNLDNQRILSHVLQRLGLHVAVADHGRAALERALAEPFDLVLMDMQMPEMDGYAATSQLRQRGYTRPIVALTANAMRGDEEKCLRAGCSAYLTKPVDRNQLATVLSQFLQPSEASSTGSMYSGVPDPAFQSLVREYVAGLSATRVQMAQAFAAGDLKQLASLAHQVKGAAGMYGFAELGESAGLIESACRENQETDLIGELLNEFDDLIRLARHLTGQTDKREEKE